MKWVPNQIRSFMENDSKIIEIFSGTPWEAEMVKSLLENAEIESFIKNAVFNSNMYDPIYASGTKVMILESNKSRAKMVVDEYYENLKKKSDE